MQLLSSESILLRRREFQDSNWIVTFLTADRGLLKGVVRGARKLTSRGVGDFEPLSMGVVYYHAHPNRELVQIRKRDRSTTSWFPVQSYEKFCYGSYLAELVEIRPIEAKQNAIYYQLLSKSLQDIFQIPRIRLLPLVRLRFELKLLRLMGIQPNWSKCMNCEIIPPWSGVSSLSFASGGMLCPKCAYKKTAVAPIDQSALAFINAWLNGSASPKPQKDWLEQLLTAISAYLLYHAGRHPRSLKLLPSLDELAARENNADMWK